MTNGHQGKFITCDKSACALGGIIAPGVERIKNDRGVFHRDCATPVEREQHTRDLAQLVIVESQAQRARLAAELAAQEERLRGLRQGVMPVRRVHLPSGAVITLPPRLSESASDRPDALRS